jgi:hypothetical protein
MRHPGRFTTGILAAVTVLASHAAEAASAPRWLTEAARRPAAPIERDAEAVVLHDEEHVTVQSDGRIVRKRAFAVRVQTRGGARAATLREIYRTGSGEVRELKAWLLIDGAVTELGRKDIVDVALVDNDVYNEVRARSISAADQAAPGMVFGGESEKVESTVFAQIEWWLQSRWPVREARRSLTLPAGWQAQAVTLNRAPLTAAVEKNTHTWTIRDLSAPVEEPAGPPDSSMIPRLAVTYFGAPRADAAFDSWDGVGRWLAALQDPQSASTLAVAAKARELTASATTDLERIRAIGAHAQKVQYISIQTGVGRGGGYKPHAAAEVLEKNYGDCKDKANLMRALLATVNIPSFLVGVYAGDPGYVREEWPSPQQFNHAIIAIPVAKGTSLPAVASDGSQDLLFFDPTDRFTPVGQLPLTLQDSLGLVVSPSGSRLRRLPAADASAHGRIRTIVGTLGPDGVLSMTIRSSTSGHVASRERALHGSLPNNGYARRVEAEIRARISSATATLDPIADDAERNRLEVSARAQARPFGGATQGNLLFLPSPLPLTDALPLLRPGQRQTPVVLNPRDDQERFELMLPPGVTVDELPAPQTVETPYGRYDVRWSLEDRKLIRTLALKVTRSVVPPADYASVRAFVDRFLDAEKQPAVLRRR